MWACTSPEAHRVSNVSRWEAVYFSGTVHDILRKATVAQVGETVVPGAFRGASCRLVLVSASSAVGKNRAFLEISKTQLSSIRTGRSSLHHLEDYYCVEQLLTNGSIRPALRDGLSSRHQQVVFRRRKRLIFEVENSTYFTFYVGHSTRQTIFILTISNANNARRTATHIISTSFSTTTD